MQQAKETIEGVGGASVEYEAETVIATVTGVNTGPGHSTVTLEGMAVLTTAAGTTETTLRLRREGLAGTLVSTVVVKPGASAKLEVGVQAQDTPPGEVVNATYVITAQETAAAKGKSISSRLTATF